jgi:hypothetical protein
MTRQIFSLDGLVGILLSLARPLSPALGRNIDHNGQDQDNPLDNLLLK